MSLQAAFSASRSLRFLFCEVGDRGRLSGGVEKVQALCFDDDRRQDVMASVLKGGSLVTKASQILLQDLASGLDSRQIRDHGWQTWPPCLLTRPSLPTWVGAPPGRSHSLAEASLPKAPGRRSWKRNSLPFLLLVNSLKQTFTTRLSCLLQLPLQVQFLPSPCSWP